MKTKEILRTLCVLAVVLGGFASCSSDDKDDYQESPILGAWNIQDLGATVKGSHEAINAVIKNDIEEVMVEVPVIGELSLKPWLPFITLTFEKDNNFKAVLDLTTVMGDPTDPFAPVVAKGKYSYNADQTLAFNKIESIDLGYFKELLESMGPIPGLDPEMIEKLPELASALLPIRAKVVQLKEGANFEAELEISQFYNTPEKIESLIKKAKLENVEAKDVKIESILVTIKCKIEAKK